MNILVSNDDGINAGGIRALVKALSNKGNVYVCAPDGQRSGKSQSITLKGRIFVEEVKDFEGAKKAWQTTGTPADCVKMGLQLLKDEGVKVDMIFAGINLGSNVGKDTLYSGTVGAAKEAALSGYQAVAVSVDSHDAILFDGACKLAVDVIDLVYGKYPSTMIVNINTPHLPIEEIKGVRITKLGSRYYDDEFRPCDDEIGGYKLSGQPGNFNEDGEDLDVTAIQNGYASITPLHFDYTDYESIEEIDNWNLKI